MKYILKHFEDSKACAFHIWHEHSPKDINDLVSNKLDSIPRDEIQVISWVIPLKAWNETSVKEVDQGTNFPKCKNNINGHLRTLKYNLPAKAKLGLNRKQNRDFNA